jgi:thymidylate synthase
MINSGARATPLDEASHRVLVEGQIDQLLNALIAVRNRSRSRRIMVRTFNPTFLGLQNLPPCHTDVTFNVTKARDYERAQMKVRGDIVSEDSLHITVHLRSSDVALGRPFNVAHYSAMHHMFAIYAGLNIGSFCIASTNTHIYSHHIEGMKQIPIRVADMVKEAIETNIVPKYPTLYVDPEIRKMEPKELLDSVNLGMFRWTDYEPLPHIPFRVTK